MKRIIIFLAINLLYNNCFSQNNSKFSIQISHGVNGNFFVRDYDELGGPAAQKYFYKKNFIGTVSGVSFSSNINQKSAIFLEYNRSVNRGKKNYAGTVGGVDVFINDFKLQHTNNIYQIGYAHTYKMKNKKLVVDMGPMLIYDKKQTIEIENYNNFIIIDEGDFEDTKSVEGGAFLGVGFSGKIDTKFELGLKARIYYLISTGSLEAISLSPTLSYNF